MTRVLSMLALVASIATPIAGPSHEYVRETALAADGQPFSFGLISR